MWRSLAGVAVFCLLPRQGPAVWALRAQTDKLEYSRTMRSILEQEPNLHLREVRRQAMGSWFSGPQHMKSCTPMQVLCCQPLPDTQGTRGAHHKLLS